MKKRIIFLFLLIIIFCFCGCNNTTTAPNQVKNNLTTPINFKGIIFEIDADLQPTILDEKNIIFKKDNSPDFKLEICYTDSLDLDFAKGYITGYSDSKTIVEDKDFFIDGNIAYKHVYLDSKSYGYNILVARNSNIYMFFLTGALDEKDYCNQVIQTIIDTIEF